MVEADPRRSIEAIRRRVVGITQLRSGSLPEVEVRALRLRDRLFVGPFRSEAVVAPELIPVLQVQVNSVHDYVLEKGSDFTSFPDTEELIASGYMIPEEVKEKFWLPEDEYGFEAYADRQQLSGFSDKLRLSKQEVDMFFRVNFCLDGKFDFLLEFSDPEASSQRLRGTYSTGGLIPLQDMTVEEHSIITHFL